MAHKTKVAMQKCLLFTLSAGLMSASVGFSQAIQEMPMRHDMNHSHEVMPQVAKPGASMPPDLLQETKGHETLRLRDFEEMAFRQNPTLKQASNLVQRTAGLAKQAGLYPNPSIGYDGEQIRGGQYGGGEQGAFVQQTIVLGGKLGLRRRSYEEQRREEQIGVAEQRSRLKSDVGQSFYRNLAAQETVGVRLSLLALSQNAVETAHQLENVGQADAPDVLQAEVEAEQAQVDYITAQRAFIQQFRSLAALVGNPSLSLTKLQGDLQQAPAIDVQTVVESLVRDSPSVKRARQAVIVAEAQLKSTRREPVPDITVRAGLQQNYEAINQAGRSTGVQGFGLAAITLPIFNRNQGNVQAARADLEAAQAELQRVQLSLRQMAEPMLQTYLADEAQIARYRTEMIPRAFRAYQLYLGKYQNMAAAYPLVIVSQRTFFQLRISYIRALQDLWMNAIALQNFTLTGGLDAPIPSSSSPPMNNLPNAGNGSGG